jgi:hypothetical protein
MIRCAVVLAIVAGSAGCARVSGLPPVPDSVTRADAGLDGIEQASREARAFSVPVTEAERAGWVANPPAEVVDRYRQAAERIARKDDEAAGFRALGALVESAPSDLVLGNAFRMQVYRAKRAFFSAAAARGERSPPLPAHLAAEPMATLQRAAASRTTRELGVQIALASVDQMVLSPALEVKAPASIDSVHAFSAVLRSDPYYVPALVGRGLNHLNRPRNLVWPEKPAPAADAASADMAMAAAVGAKVGGASSRVKGLLLLLLGDAYAHEGKAGIARGWWTVAQESTGDPGVQAELALRAQWPEQEMPDRLEARLEERMADMDAPLSDLSFLWDDSARGPW